MRRRLLAITVLLVLAAGAVVLATRGDDRRPRPRPPAPAGLEPLAFMPAGASAVLDFDTTQAPAAFAAIGLIPELPGSPLDAGQVQRLTGGRIAVALEGGRIWIAAQSRRPPPRPSGPAVAGTRGGTVVVAPDAARLQASLAGAAAEAPTVRA